MEEGQHIHSSQKWRMRSTHVMLLWWRRMERDRATRSSTSGALNWSAKNKSRVLGQLQTTVLLESLCRRFAVVFGEERELRFSVALSVRLQTQDQKKKKKPPKKHTPKKILYTSFPVFCFCGTLTVTHSHWVNKLQSLNCILEQGTSKSYNRTGLDGKTGINLTSVHRFVWCLYIAFLSFTPGPPSLPHTIPIPFQLWFRAQQTPLWNSLSLRP